MNIIQLQDRLKGLSQDQLVQEMQMPTGQVPQFLVLSELTRRKKMEDSFAMEQGRDQSTVAQDAVAAAGMPAQFAGQMAGTMAPQTDMTGNTGAMPQQSAMPPQRMAGGGIVALQGGGQVSSTPQLVVRGGRQFARMADGSLIPLSELGFDEAEMSGAGTADLAAPSSGVRQGAIPSQSDLDAGARNEAVGINQVPPQLPTYGADSFMDAYLPGPETQAGRSDAVGLTRTMQGLAGPDMQAARSYPPSIQGEARLPRAPLGPDVLQENFDFMGELGPVEPYVAPPLVPGEMPMNAMEQLYQSEAQQRGPRTRSPEVAIREPAAEGSMFDFLAVDPEAAPFESLERFFFPNRDPAEIRARRLAGAGQPAPAEPAQPSGDGLLPPDEPVAPIDVAPAVAAAPSGAGGAGGAGGIAAMAAQGAPSDYEQELLKMLESREKRATQDKWLALAQAGMALMSSTAPTFGQALGEAGQAGIGALREVAPSAEADRVALLGQLEQSRMGREKLALERQALAARSAARGGAGAESFGELSAGQGRLLSQYTETITALDEVLAGGVPGVTEAQRLAAARQREALIDERNSVIRSLAGVPFGAVAGGGSGVYSMDDVTQ